MTSEMAKPRQLPWLQMLRSTHGAVCCVITIVCVLLSYNGLVPALDKYVWLAHAVNTPGATSWTDTVFEHSADDLCFIGFWSLGLTSLRVFVQSGPLQLLGTLARAVLIGWLAAHP